MSWLEKLLPPKIQHTDPADRRIDAAPAASINAVAGEFLSGIRQALDQ